MGDSHSRENHNWDTNSNDNRQEETFDDGISGRQEEAVDISSGSDTDTGNSQEEAFDDAISGRQEEAVDISGSDTDTGNRQDETFDDGISGRQEEAVDISGSDTDTDRDSDTDTDSDSDTKNHHDEGKSPSPSNDSVSAKFRKEGNEKYKKALQVGIASLIKRSGLEDAVRSYNKAANTASEPTRLVDWSSAMKNHGMAMKRLGQEFMQQEEADAASGYIKSLSAFKESLKSMGQALKHGMSCQRLPWGAKIQEEIEEAYNEILEITNTFEDRKQKVRELYRVVELLPPALVKARAKFHIADVYFKESVRLLESGDFKDCLRHLHDIHQPVEEALSILRKIDSTEEVKDLRDDLMVLKQNSLYQMSSAESMQARRCGENLLTEMLRNEDGINLDFVWDIFDWFKQASLKAAELDLEQEAAALSFLGYMNEKILFSTAKTRRYYTKCLELVDAAKPKTFLTQTWYQQCTAGLKKIQDAERQRDEVYRRSLKEKILEGLKDEIFALKKADTSAGKLLEHIYKHHPPSQGRKFTDVHLEEFLANEKRSDSTEEKKARKKLLLKACLDFHPDKFAGTVEEGETEEDQNKRKVFNEEITKKVTHHYEVIKLG